MARDMPPEEVAAIRRIAASPTPTEALFEMLGSPVTLMHDFVITLLDRVPDDDLPGLAEAVAQHLPEEVADELGQQLMLQAPHLIDEHRDRLSDDEPYLWLEQRWDGDRDLVALPAHHIVLQRGLADVSKPWMNTPPWQADQWPALELPDPTWHPAAPAVGEGRVGGEAEGNCSACGWQLQRLLDFGTFPGVADGTVPRETSLCSRFDCMWDEQFFSHADGTPSSLPRQSSGASDGMPVPEPLPVLPVTFHPTPPRWQVQDWGGSNGNQNLNRVGGAGSWIQDAIYPRCPTCDLPMPLVAQLDASTPLEDSPGWEQWTEGIIYAFWCRNCRVSAVTAQQT